MRKLRKGHKVVPILYTIKNYLDSCGVEGPFIVSDINMWLKNKGETSYEPGLHVNFKMANGMWDTFGYIQDSHWMICSIFSYSKACKLP